MIVLGGGAVGIDVGGCGVDEAIGGIDGPFDDDPGLVLK
jgi:hypothetical protein